jgi:hypothetical protein
MARKPTSIASLRLLELLALPAAPNAMTGMENPEFLSTVGHRFFDLFTYFYLSIEKPRAANSCNLFVT